MAFKHPSHSSKLERLKYHAIQWLVVLVDSTSDLVLKTMH